MFRPGLEIPVQERVHPVPVPRDRDLAVVAGDYLGHAPEVIKGIVAHPDPVPDITFGHTLAVEVVAVLQGGDEDRDLRREAGIPPVMEKQRLPREIKLQVDSRIPLDVEHYLL